MHEMSALNDNPEIKLIPRYFIFATQSYYTLARYISSLDLLWDQHGNIFLYIIY